MPTPGIEPGSSALQAAAWTTTARSATTTAAVRTGIEPVLGGVTSHSPRQRRHGPVLRGDSREKPNTSFSSVSRRYVIGAGGIEPPLHGHQPRVLPLDDAPRMKNESGWQGSNLRSLASDASAIPLRYTLEWILRGEVHLGIEPSCPLLQSGAFAMRASGPSSLLFAFGRERRLDADGGNRTRASRVAPWCPTTGPHPRCTRQEGVEPSAAGFGGPCPCRWGFCRRGDCVCVVE